MLENYRTGIQVEAAAEAMQLLALLGNWRHPASLARALPEFGSSSITRTLDALAREHQLRADSCTSVQR